MDAAASELPYSLLANGQPIFTRQFLGLDQFESRTILDRTGIG